MRKFVKPVLLVLLALSLFLVGSYGYRTLTEQLESGIRTMEWDVRLRRGRFELTHVPIACIVRGICWHRSSSGAMSNRA